MCARGEGPTVNLAATFHQDPSWTASLHMPYPQHNSCRQCQLGARTAPISANCTEKGLQAADEQGQRQP